MICELNKVLDNTQSPSPTYILLGDFNFPSKDIQWESVEGSLIPIVHNHRESSGHIGARKQAELLCDIALK